MEPTIPLVTSSRTRYSSHRPGGVLASPARNSLPDRTVVIVFVTRGEWNRHAILSAEIPRCGEVASPGAGGHGAARDAGGGRVGGGHRVEHAGTGCGVRPDVVHGRVHVRWCRGPGERVGVDGRRRTRGVAGAVRARGPDGVHGDARVGGVVRGRGAVRVGRRPAPRCTPDAICARVSSPPPSGATAD